MTNLPLVISHFFDVVERLDVQYRVGGSFASSAWGAPRQTHDLDVAIVLNRQSAQGLVDQLKDTYLVSDSDVTEALRSREDFRGFQLLHMDEVFKIDLFLVADDEYQQAAFAKSRDYELFPGKQVKFSSPEDTVITKLRWFELGNRVSDKQWNDIVQVLEMQQGQLDEHYLVRWAEHFGVTELLEKAQSQIFEIGD